MRNIRLTPLQPIFDPEKRMGAIVVGNSPGSVVPIACFTFDIDPYIVLPIPFTDCSFVVGGTIVAWHWDFGDSTTSSVQNPVHSYAVLDTIYNVTLTVTDNNSMQASITQPVPVGAIDAVWYSRLQPFSSVVWPVWAVTQANDLATEAENGAIWFDAWYKESGYTPASYDSAVDVFVGGIVFSFLDWQFDSPVIWPNWATTQANDLATEAENGAIWFDAWYKESTFEPSSYDDALNNFVGGVVWHSNLDELSTSQNAQPDGGDSFFDDGGYRYLVFTSDGPFYTGITSGTLTVEACVVGAGGSGGRPGATNQRGGGGGGGEVAISTISGIAAGVIPVTVASTTAQPAAGNPGNTGASSSLGSLLVASGGSGGGIPAVNGGAGVGGSGSGGGGAASTSVSGAGGSAGDGNAGGSGAAAATVSQQRAGGGGGAGSAGTSGVANGQRGDGGDGVEYPAGDQKYGAGGGGATGNGTALGGSGAGNASTGSGGNGSANRGGGGGGASNTSSAGSGGSGRVIIRVPII